METETKLSDVKEQMEQSSLEGEEEGLKMKMNIVLMPKQYQSFDEHIKIEDYQSAREGSPSESVLSHNSRATSTTYESTQDFSTTTS